ncbi:MAG: vitamin B12-dependent ribonucleotide reductase [Oscillospiraceae bacterium]
MFTQNARTVLERRYLAKDENGKVVETVEEMFRRVASTIAAADAAYGKSEDEIQRLENEFYEMMTECEFMPNSPTLMNAGRPLGQLSACFVLPVGDSMSEIFDTLKYAALVHQSGGGTGFSFSRLRQEGSIVRSTGGVASGPVSFMKVFNSATEAVKQGGTRRGANMGMLRIDHPDILRFIDCKENNNEINNFNISVAITDKFMKAVENGEKYELISPHNGEVVDTLDAREVFEKIVDAAWRNGEPGVVFIDEMNRHNPTPALGEIESTNPCGEQPLLPYEACNLGSINLSLCVTEEDGIRSIDYDKLTEIVHKAVHFLDNVIDVNHYPLPIIDETTKRTRKIGLGIMGFADMLLKLGVPYNSVEAEQAAEEVMSLIQSEGRKASCELAAERGVFPAWEDSVFGKEGLAIRNATVTTIAPTGTISIIADASGGCEPLFAYAFTKNVMDGDKLLVCNDLLVEKLKECGVYSEEIMQRIADEGTLAHIEEIPAEIRRVFVCAHDISPEWHIRIQAAFQKYTDNAVSKTINFPNSATREEVKEAYLLAYKLKCKGTTVYRDGSRDSQVLTTGSAKKEEPVPAPIPGVIVPRPRPNLTWGATEKIKIGCGSLFITVNRDEQGICEVFTSTGKGGGCPSQSEATARLVSIALRAGISQDEILAQLKGIRCPSTVRQPGLKCTSCPDAIARTIAKMSKMLDSAGNISIEEEEETPPKKAEGGKPAGNKPVVGPDDKLHCPECGKLLRHEGGCTICDCGFSHCG